jgi:hypothetical protein
MNALRFRFGLRWSRHYPTMADLRDALRSLFYVLCLVLAYGVVGAIDYAEEQRIEALAQARSSAQATALLADCMNGTARFVHSGPHTDGHGVTGIACRPAEEYRL